MLSSVIRMVNLIHSATGRRLENKCMAFEAPYSRSQRQYDQISLIFESVSLQLSAPMQLTHYNI